MATLTTTIGNLCEEAKAWFQVSQAYGEPLSCITIQQKTKLAELCALISGLRRSRQLHGMLGFSNITSIGFRFLDADAYELSEWRGMAEDLRLLRIQEVSLWTTTPADNTLTITCMLTGKTCRKLWIHDLSNSEEVVHPVDMFEDWIEIHSFSELQVLGLETRSTLFGNWMQKDEEEEEKEEFESVTEAEKVCAEREHEWITSFSSSCPKLSAVAFMHSLSRGKMIWDDECRACIWEKKSTVWEVKDLDPETLFKDHPAAIDPHYC